MPIDPVQYGQMLKAVETMEADMQQMKANIATLLELANKSKGGLWVGMSFAAFLSSVATWIVTHFSPKP